MWFKKKKKEEPTQLKDCGVRIKVEDALIFTGTIKWFDIHTDIKGSEAEAVITFKATDLIRAIRATGEEDDGY